MYSHSCSTIRTLLFVVVAQIGYCFRMAFMPLFEEKNFVNLREIVRNHMLYERDVPRSLTHRTSDESFRTRTSSIVRDSSRTSMHLTNNHKPKQYDLEKQGRLGSKRSIGRGRSASRSQHTAEQGAFGA